MPVTLANVVVPDVFSRYTRFLSVDISALVQSGAVVVDSRLNASLGAGSTIFDFPFWDALSQSASNVGSDDPATDATLNNIAAANSKAPRMSRNNAWGSMHLAMTDSGEDSQAAIQAQLANYWAIELQKIVIAALSGINKDNGGNDSGDMAHDVVGTSFTDNVTNFTIANLVDSAQTLGDHKFGLSVLVVHSVVASKMEKLEYVTVGVRPSAGAQLATMGPVHGPDHRHDPERNECGPSRRQRSRGHHVRVLAVRTGHHPHRSRRAAQHSRRGSGQLAAVRQRRRPNRSCAESGIHDCRSGTELFRHPAGRWPFERRHLAQPEPCRLLEPHREQPQANPLRPTDHPGVLIGCFSSAGPDRYLVGATL